MSIVAAGFGIVIIPTVAQGGNIFHRAGSGKGRKSAQAVIAEISALAERTWALPVPGGDMLQD